MNTIYILRNRVNDKIYIGQTWQRLKDRYDCGYGYKGCTHLFSAIKKYGHNNFYYETITFCGTQEAADSVEQVLIAKYNSTNPSIGYNISLGGATPNKGRKHSIATKLKMSLAKKGKKKSNETKAKMSLAKTGVKPSTKTRNKMSLAKLGKASWNKGTILTEKQKENMSQSALKRGNNFPSHKNETWKLIGGKRIWSTK